MASMAPTLDLTQPTRLAARVHVRTSVWLLAGTLLLVWCVSLSRSLFDPIGFDQAFWQYVTERVLAGERMYVDVWDQNAPGVIGIHALATLLVGRSPMSLRVFDAGWQCLTLAALISLGWRDGRRSSVGWLAAVLYALAYYGTGYVHTAQRDGFAVLPMLLALHVVGVPPRESARPWRVLWLHAFAGVMCFVIFAIKPPLGLFFAVFWLQCLADGWSRRRAGRSLRVHPKSRVGPASSRSDFRVLGCTLNDRAPWCDTDEPRASARAVLPSRWRPTIAHGHLAFLPWAGLTAGFVVAGVVSIALLVHWDWWSGFLRAMSRAEVTDYALGPSLVRQLLLSALMAITAIGIALACMAHLHGRRNQSIEGSASSRSPARSRQRWAWWHAGWTASVVAIAMLTIVAWSGWQPIALSFGGLILPAFGAILMGAWRGRSRIWRLQVLLAAVTLALIVFHGHFSLYHFYPLWACLSYLSAQELVTRWSRTQDPRPKSDPDQAGGRSLASDPILWPGVWAAVCLGAVVHFAVGYWGHRMTFPSAQPYLLAGTTLMGHYDRVTRHKPSYPLYSTTARVAERVRGLTEPMDPIACLINEPRLYYLSQRPAAHRMIITNAVYQPLFEEFVQTIHRKRPKVLLARIPEAARGATDLAVIHAAVFADAESFFGPPARLLRNAYRVAEVINDVCILRPTR